MIVYVSSCWLIACRPCDDLCVWPCDDMCWTVFVFQHMFDHVLAVSLLVVWHLDCAMWVDQVLSEFVMCCMSYMFIVVLIVVCPCYGPLVVLSMWEGDHCVDMCDHVLTITLLCGLSC